MELELEELEVDATEDEIAAERAAAKITNVSAFERRRAARKPFPEHLPRERQWKVIQTVREKFTCRDCEKISQSPAALHTTLRGWAGPNLLATILFEKFSQHQPLNRQAERYAREDVDLSLSTLADQVGACATGLQPIHDLIRADGRLCLTNNAAERALRGIGGGDRGAFMYSLFVSAKMNDIDPQAWLMDFLARLPSNPLSSCRNCYRETGPPPAGWLQRGQTISV